MVFIRGSKGDVESVVEGDPPAAAAQARTLFVGRGRELAELRSGLQDAAAARGRLFLLSGEPGIGKTRLAEELSAHAGARGMRVVWGRCWQGAGRPAYWPFAQALSAALEATPDSSARKIAREIAPLIPRLTAARPARARTASRSAPSDPEQLRLKIFDAVTRIFGALAARIPILVVFDDLQDAEHASWLMLRYAARALEGSRVMFVAAYRELEVRSVPALGPVIADLLRGAHHIGLGGLSRAEVGEFIETSAGRAANRALVERLHSTTGGNPFFVTEVVRTLVHSGALDAGGALEIPDTVRASIRGRVLALPGDPVAALSSAAALGDLFDLDTLRRVARCEVGTLLGVIDAAVQAGIVVSVPGDAVAYRFAHSLMREVMYEDLDAGERMRLHQRCLEVLEKRYRAEPELHLDQLAHHAVAAAAVGDREKAIDYATRAGEAAYAAAAFERAAGHFRAALELVGQDGTDPVRTATMLERLGEALAITESEQPRGIECLERAAKIYESAGRPVDGARVRARLALMLSTRAPAMNIGRAMEQYRRAERVLGRLADSASQVWMYCGLANTAMHAQRLAEGMAAAQRATEIAARLGDEHLWLQAAARRADQLFLAGRFAESLNLANDAWHRADRGDDTAGAFEAAWSGGYFLLTLWNPRAARRWFERELGRPRLAAAPYHRQILLQQSAFCCVFMGELLRARTLLERAPRALVSGFLDLYEGNWERAEEVLEEGRLAVRNAGSRDLELVHCYFESVVLRARGAVERARELVAHALGLSAEARVLPFELHLRAEAALLALCAGCGDEALMQAAKIRARIPAGEELYGLGGRIGLALALAETAAGGEAQAADGFAAAMAKFRRYGLPWEQAQALMVRARIAAGRGESAAAALHLDEAAEIYRRHGASARFLEQIESERRRAPSAGAAPAGIARNGDSVGPRPPTGVNTISNNKWEALWSAEGEYWSISFRGSQIRLRDTKGLRYIAVLLARPRVLVASIELARNGAARKNGRDGLSRERARLSVTKNIRGAVARIRALEPDLGRHLATAIRTGYACVYDPENPVGWNVGGIPAGGPGDRR
jgi:tetratricopeptide (TPR) repeat protein